MKKLDRRSFLQLSATAGAASLLPAQAAASAASEANQFPDARAILYDATRCIGCRSCARTCREVKNLDPLPDDVNGVKFDMPSQLGEEDFMVIQLCESSEPGEDGEKKWSFFKRNCMHCNSPACASACPVAALVKTPEGPVVYHEHKCIGCRYCLLACPYTVPRYQWLDRMPRVRKCDFNGACVAACPVGALKMGPRAELINEAHRRIADEPERYVDHLYGEHEAGGTSYLILSGIAFEDLDLPDLPSTVRSSYSDAIMGGLPGWIIGLGLFLGGLYQVNRWQERRAAQNPGQEDAS